MLLFIETGFINAILLKINFISSKFLLSHICSLIFLQSKGGKIQTLWIENICFMFRNNFFHKNTVAESETPSLLQKRKRGSAKSDVSKVLFLDIGKIPMPGNNATLKIDFTDLRKWNFVRSLVGIMIRNDTTVLSMNVRLITTNLINSCIK